MMEKRRHYPFAAVIGQDGLKRAYIANIVNPRIGGLLISGAKGTGKSTVVHSVEDILPHYEAVAGCIFSCDPRRHEDFCTLCRERSDIESVEKKMKIVNLPLSCTEDRLIGSIDVEKLLKKGEKDVIPGILGQANRNILYIDEVNLLPDHLVDDILDAAAMHWNTIEREGISVNHPSEFVLVGTMNPEEGDLRPQILDRFPLCVKIGSVQDKDDRVEIVNRNLMFENHPDKFFRQFADQQKKWAEKIVRARTMLSRVSIDQSLVAAVAESCAELKVDGQRPDIVIVKTAQTLAAIDARTTVIPADVSLASGLALVHRTRDGGLLEPPAIEEIDRVFGAHLVDLKKTSPGSRSAVGSHELETQKEVKKNH